MATLEGKVVLLTGAARRIGAVLARFFAGEDEIAALLSGFAKHSMRNWNGIHVGDVRVSDALFTA